MDNDFFNTGPDEFFLDDSSNSANGFSSMTGIPSSNSAHVGDASSQFVHSSSWWDESLAFGELDPSGLQSNGLQSADLQHIPHASHDRALYKSYPSGHNMQASPQDVFLGVPGITNAHSRGAAPWIPFPYRQNSGPITPRESECQGMYKNSPILEHQEFIQGSQDISTFGDDFGGGNNVPIPALSPNQFTAADLGRIPQPQNADDTASLAYTQASCNSKCTSSVCENENCSVTGIPCDDPACVENDLSTGVLNLANQAPTQVTAELAVFRPLHTQPCNHTESEHIVARTLGELRAPAELDALEKTSYTSSFDYTLVTRAGEQFYDYYQPYPTPSQPPTEVESFASHDPRIPSQSNSPLLIPPSVVDNPERHICKWIAQGERTICGAEFTNTKDFHDHLCEFHIDKLPSQAGCACLWSGCPRGQDRPFGTRGKLRRHISTHSVYKPYTCSICKQGFSGQQALQQHERIHTGDKPFKCTVEGCTMAFKQKSALTMHSRVHTGEKPLQCEYCGKAFPESSNLSKHRKIHLVKSSKFTCEEIVKGEPCGRSFRRLDQLRRHRLTHTNSGKRKAAHNRSMSAISNTTGEMLHHTQLPTTPSGEMQ